MKIYSELKDGKDIDVGKIILEGNEEVSDREFGVEYKTLVLKNPLTLDIFTEPESYPDYDRVIDFEKKLNKHFSAPIAAKVRWYLNYLMAKNIAESKGGFFSQTATVFEGSPEIC